MLRLASNPAPQRTVAPEIEVLGMTKRFGAFTALEEVSLRIAAGSFHALLGENGAGKSTLVKCLAGYHRPDAGQISIDRRERDIRSPQDARTLGIGMVYQHFTLVPSMTVAENLVMARGRMPALIDWRGELDRLQGFLATVPFKLDPRARISSLAAGEKQKVEIVKQLYLDNRFVILDEPTSVLTPGEADQVLGLLRDLCRRKVLSVLLITHKFREVMAFADQVTVLRRGRVSGEGSVSALDADTLATMMIGSRDMPTTSRARVPARHATPSAQRDIRLRVQQLHVTNDRGLPAVQALDLDVHAGEIVGVAGVSGNGQRELVETLIGQRAAISGTISIAGEAYRASRAQIARLGVLSLPEEPLRNACVAQMSVAENMALRNFDRTPLRSGPWLRAARVRAQAQRLIAEFKVKSGGADAPMCTLSGGNVQRAVLARELSSPATVLIAANPVFGLDFAAVAEIHQRILNARDAGAAVLLVSEDLDELLELSDRIVVMFGGRIVHETAADAADVSTIGRCMAGNAEAAAPTGSLCAPPAVRAEPQPVS